MTNMRECSACGAVSYDVAPRIVELTDGTFAAELRCSDSEACSDRVTAQERTPI